ASGCSPALVSAVFSDANELSVTVNCGLSRPYFGKSDATSATKFVTCSPASRSIKRRASAALAGRLFRLTIVQFWSLRASTVFVFRSEEHTSELQSRGHLVCRLLLEKKKRSHQYLRDIASFAGTDGIF